MLNINANINGARKGLPYPTAGLQVIVYNSTYEDEGTTYLRTSTGVGIPKVSGTGNDTIWDFSVLNDARFDKGSYVGNDYGLPEYYDFPFVNIYFDETTEATRYHWKLKDFHYANLLAQSLLLDNQMFLRAKATTETSNEISEVYQLNIYESEQTGSALTKLKSWMRIAPDFRGENVITGIVNISIGLGNDISYVQNGNLDITFTLTDTTNSENYRPSFNLSVNDILTDKNVELTLNVDIEGDISFYGLRIEDIGERLPFLANGVVIERNTDILQSGTYFLKNSEFVNDGLNATIYINGENSINGTVIRFYDIEIKAVYINYYKP